MLIDRFLPRFDVRSRHELEVDAPPATAYEAVMGFDLSNSLPVKALLGLRALPRLLRGGGRGPGTLTLGAFEELGFVALGEKPGEEIVLGAVGRFWRANGGILRIEPDDFTTFEEPGYAKAAMNLRVRPRGEGSLVTTETRVLCTDESSRTKFRIYWSLVGPFSGLIRLEILREIRRASARLGAR